MTLTSRSTVTAARLCCWSTAGTDPARLECTMPEWKSTCSDRDPACLYAGLASDRPTLAELGNGARPTGILLHRPRQPIPHRAR